MIGSATSSGEASVSESVTSSSKSSTGIARALRGIIEYGQPKGERDALVYQRIRETTMYLFAIGGWGIAMMVLYALQFSAREAVSIVAVAVLLAGAAGWAGALIGFLFGIPRVLHVDQGRGVAPNTNLEQISDWLTKILVGVTLTQVPAFGAALGELIAVVGPALGGRDSSEVLAGAILLYYAGVGFMNGYLWTRIYVQSTLGLEDQHVEEPSTSKTEVTGMELLSVGSPER